MMASPKNILTALFKALPHLLYWVGYLMLAYVSNAGHQPGVPLGAGVKVDFMLWAVWNIPFKLAILYGYAYWVIPKWLYTKTWRFIGVSLLLLALYPPIKVFLDQQLGIAPLYFIQFQGEIKGVAVITAIEYLLRVATVLGCIAAAILLRLITDWFKNMQLQKNMQVLQLQGELDMLRSQINPHFLFNTLNNIDSMIYKVSPEGSDAIGKLASIMRYMLYESNVPKVSLEKELAYLQSYFDLQRIRFRNQQAIQMIIEGDASSILVAPLLYIPFVENAFKHGTLQENGLLLHCHIRVEGSVVFFSIESGYNPDLPQEKDRVGGIGLNNVQRRLELLYPKKYQLEIKAESPIYSVTLTLDTQ